MPTGQSRTLLLRRLTALAMGMLLGAGCSSTNLYLEVEGPHIADSAGIEVQNLKFITNGDIVETASPDEADGEQIPMEAAPHRYSLYTKGVIAVSEEGVFWAHEEVERAKPEDFLSIPLSEIEAIQRIPDNALLVRTKTRDLILRPHSWTKYAGDDRRLNMLRTALVDQGVKVIFTMAEVAHVKALKPPPEDNYFPDPYSELPSLEIPDPFGHFKR